MLENNFLIIFFVPCRSETEPVLYILKEVGGSNSKLIKCVRNNNIWEEKEILLSNVVEFEIRDDYMFATKSVVSCLIISLFNY